MTNRFVKCVIGIFITLWFGWYFCHPTDLLPTDLGRHIINGQILLTSPDNAWKILSTNYYSYATPAAPFINHHWLIDIFFYILWKLGGFGAIGIWFAGTSIITFWLFFRLAIKRAGFTIASLVALFLIPLITTRLQIRPETISYLFAALYLTLLTGVFKQTTAPNKLFWLIPLQILWVNIHIYFFVGPLMVAIFYFSNRYHTHPSRPTNTTSLLGLTTILTGLASILNPHTLYGAIYPALILKNYKLPIGENASIYHLDSLGINIPYMFIFKLACIALIFGYLVIILKNKKRIILHEISMGLVFIIAGYTMVRNCVFFGLIALPLLAGVVSECALLAKIKTLSLKKYLALVLGVSALLFTIDFRRIMAVSQHTGFNLLPETSDAATFINQNQLPGPLFNTFDIGGYTIFHFFPRLKPFIDNRPEAYSKIFVENEYLPLLINDSAWQDALQKYNFNLIIYSLEDGAADSHMFIFSRINDPAWAPVFANQFTIVLLRRTPKNRTFIQNHELPSGFLDAILIKK